MKILSPVLISINDCQTERVTLEQKIDCELCFDVSGRRWGRLTPASRSGKVLGLKFNFLSKIKMDS